MNQQGSSGIRSPRSPTFSHTGALVQSPKSEHEDKNQPTKSSSWWSSFWDSSVVVQTPETKQLQPILKTPDYDCLQNCVHLEGDKPEEIHHNLMFPQVGDERTSTSAYRLQPRLVSQQQRPTMMANDDEEHVYTIPSKKALSPLRNRSPKMPNSRPPMVVATKQQMMDDEEHVFQLRSRSPKMPRSQMVAIHPTSPRSPYRIQQQQHFPKPIAEQESNESGFLRKTLFGTAKRRAAFWTVLSVLIVCPTILLGGGGGSGNGKSNSLNHGVDYSNEDISLGPYEPDEGSFSDLEHRTLAGLYDTNTFMVQDQVLNAGESKSLPTYQGVNLRQESNGNLILYNRNRVLWESGLNRGVSPTTAYMTILQADGNLVTRSMTFDMRQMQWTTSVDWSSGSRSRSVSHGEYTLMLTPNQDGLMIVRRFDGQVQWSSAPGRVNLPALPSPTRRPTPAPVAPRPVGLDLDVFQPVGIPGLAAPPSASPPVFPNTVPRSQEYTLQSGPMLGHTTHNSAKFWVFLGQSIPMQLVYWPRDDPNDAKSTTLVPDAGANNAAIKTIQGLRSNTLYLYEIRIRDKWLSQGQFKTAPSPDRPTSFKYVLASCMDAKNPNKRFPVWNEIKSKGIDFAMLPGDTVYLNYLDWTRQWEVLYGRVWYRYLQQRAEPNFANFIKTTPTYGTWDNHDFGTDYADRNQRGKDNSLKAWGDLWPLPYQGSSRGAGNYYSFSWGDVDFFVMDCRWYRSWGLGILFGDAQLAWLEDQLVASRATFKVIVTASDVMESGMTGDLDKIGRIVSRHSISGVVFNAGDIHRNEYKSQHIATWPYKVHQFTSSGLGVEHWTWRRNFAIVNVDTEAGNPEIRVDFYSANSPSQSTSWSTNRNAACSSLGSSSGNKHAQCSQRVRLSDLTP